MKRRTLKLFVFPALITALIALAPHPLKAAVNHLVNAGFESGNMEWDRSPEAYAFSYSASSLGVAAQEGSKVLELYTLAGTTVSASQAVTTGVAPGQTWTFSGYVMNHPSYPIDPESLSRVRIEYVGGSGGSFYLEPEVYSTPGPWIPFSLTTSSQTPEGITGVRFWAEFVQSSSSAGILLYDNLSAVNSVPEIPATGIIGAGVAVLAAGVYRMRQQKHRPGLQS